MSDQNGDLVPQDGTPEESGITIKISKQEHEFRDVPREFVRAMYHEITGKTERIARNLSGSKLICFQDIRSIVSKINQNAEKHDVVGRNTTIRIRFNNTQVMKFSSWEKFSEFNFDDSARTSELTIEFSFLIRNPATNRPSRYIVFVDISNADPEEDGFRFGPIKFVDRFIEYENMVRMEYVDYLVARDFISLVQDWYKNLPDSNFPFGSFGVFFRDARTRFMILNAMYIFSIIPVLIFSDIVQQGKFAQLDVFATLIALCLGWCFLTRMIIHFTFDFGSLIINPSSLVVTSGDQRFKEKLERGNKWNGRKMIGLVMSILLAVAINIFSGKISMWIGITP